MGSAIPIYKVFVSHAEEDTATIALPLREKLLSHGVTTFVDVSALRPGEEASKAITSAIENAEIAVFVLSPEFVARKQPMKELMYFLRHKHMPGGPPLGPVLIPFFYRLSSSEIRDEPGFERYDKDGKSLYLTSGFMERMNVGEPEADTRLVKAALEELGQITGIGNVVGATNDSTHLMSVRRGILIEKLCKEIVSIENVGAGPSVANVLRSGCSLFRGEHIISSDQHFTLIHQYDGNVVIYDNLTNKSLWDTSTHGKQTEILKMQEDSNLVLYAPGGQSLWASNTCLSGAKKAVMQTDGNFVLYDDYGTAKWASGTNSGTEVRSELGLDQALLPGDELTSANGNNKVRLEKDGNLILFKSGSKVWDSGTGGSGANVLVLQTDGNMVLYNDKDVWASGTENRKGHKAVIQDDGNFVIYTEEGEPIWATDTD